jgi:hypothetical protein
VLGVPTRADTVESIGELLRRGGVRPRGWFGVWLFADLWEFGGRSLDDRTQWDALARVEFEAGRRDPYRQVSRVFHLLGQRV